MSSDGRSDRRFGWNTGFDCRGWGGEDNVRKRNGRRGRGHDGMGRRGVEEEGMMEWGGEE